VAPAVVLFVAFLLAGASASASSTLSANGMRAEALPAPALRCAGQHAANFGFPDRKYAEISSLFGPNGTSTEAFWSGPVEREQGNEHGLRDAARSLTTWLGTFFPFSTSQRGVSNPRHFPTRGLGTRALGADCATHPETSVLPLGFILRLPLPHSPVEKNASGFEGVQVAPIPEGFAALCLGFGLVLASAFGNWWGES